MLFTHFNHKIYLFTTLYTAAELRRWRRGSTTGGSPVLGGCPAGLFRLHTWELVAGWVVVLVVDLLADENSWNDS